MLVDDLKTAKALIEKDGRKATMLGMLVEGVQILQLKTLVSGASWVLVGGQLVTLMTIAAW